MMDEAEYQAEALAKLAADFDYFEGNDGEGVWGRSLRDSTQRVRIDVILKAKEHVTEAGFIDRPFGLEVKAPGDEGRKVFDLAFQAQDYTLSEFNFRGGYARLAFVLIYPGFEAHDDLDLENARILRRYLQRWQVGELLFTKYGWWMGADNVYARISYDGSIQVKRTGNPPLITPRYGNYKASKNRVTHGEPA